MPSALGRCAHVAALLLKLSDDAAHNKGSMIKPSTSQPCTWNRGKKHEKNLSNCMKLNTVQSNVNHLLNYIYTYIYIYIYIYTQKLKSQK